MYKNEKKTSRIVNPGGKNAGLPPNASINHHIAPARGCVPDRRMKSSATLQQAMREAVEYRRCLSISEYALSDDALDWIRCAAIAVIVTVLGCVTYVCW